MYSAALPVATRPGNVPTAPTADRMAAEKTDGASLSPAAAPAPPAKRGSASTDKDFKPLVNASSLEVDLHHKPKTVINPKSKSLYRL